MKKINEKIKKALSFLLILTMAMTSVGVSTFSAFADSEDGTGTTELNLDTDAENTASDDTVDLAFQTDGHGKFLINGEDKTNQTITVNKGTEVTYEVTADDIDRRYNVSVDVINYTPVTLDELIAQNDVK